MLKENSMIGKFIDDSTTYSGLWTYANGDDHALYRYGDRPAAEQCTHVTQGLAILGEETDIKQQQMLAAMINARSFRTCAIRIDFRYLQGD